MLYVADGLESSLKH